MCAANIAAVRSQMRGNQLPQQDTEDRQGPPENAAHKTGCETNFAPADFSNVHPHPSVTRGDLPRFGTEVATVSEPCMTEAVKVPGDTGRGEKSMEMLTTKEVAALLKVATKSVRAMCNRGELGCIKFGQTYRVPLVELERWVEAHYHGVTHSPREDNSE